MGSNNKRCRQVRRRYLKLGVLSVVLGGLFLTLTMIATVTLFRVVAFSFFLAIGAIDVALYSAFRRR